jgi:hypothetical protein
MSAIYFAAHTLSRPLAEIADIRNRCLRHPTRDIQGGTDMENNTCESIEPAPRDRESTLEDSSEPTSPTEDSQPEIHNGQRDDHPSKPIENRQSKIENGKLPYVKTPARVAAARANLEKARSAPKEKVYRRTDKRLAANRANLAKARVARQEELEQVVDRLDVAFPPLGEEESEEETGPEVLCPCGSGETYFHCCKGKDPKTKVARLLGPQLARVLQSEREEEETKPPQEPLKFFKIGYPKWYEEGADREAADYPALEKAGRALLHRQRTLLGEAQREARQVMRLLTQAAARTVNPTLQDLLALACGLMAVLGKSVLLSRAKGLNQRVKNRLEAFVEKRYERMGGLLLPPEALCEQLLAKREQGARLLTQRQRRRPPPGSPTRPKQPPPAAQPDLGLDLPVDYQEFARLVRRAFCAPGPEAEDETVRHLLAELAKHLWDRLHAFEQELKFETERFNQVRDETYEAIPKGVDAALREGWCSIESQLKETVRLTARMFSFCAQALLQRLGKLMVRRYGRHPQIQRFRSGHFEMEAGIVNF